MPHYEAWPELNYEDFKSTQHLLHMLTQAMGKLKLLLTPYEPQWANVTLWPTSRGLSTGLIPNQTGCFSIGLDLIDHQVVCATTWGERKTFALKSSSVATLIATLFDTLQSLQIKTTINPKPQEIENPILFPKDTQERDYSPELANAWWRILISSYSVLQRYHAPFTGRSPGVGLMWGTFDLRDARYLGQSVPTTGANAGYIRRNGMDVAQVEAGWWSGNPSYPKPAYFSFLYPQPKNIELAKIKPAAARWDTKLMEFILDYDDLRKASDPARDLLAFFQSTYAANEEKAGLNKDLIGATEPV